MPATKVGVLGAGGRMGSEVCRAVASDGDLELVARLGRDDARDSLLSANVDVAVDFTAPDAVKDNIAFCVENGIHAVVGTTGLSESDLSEVRPPPGSRANVLVAPNFAIGAVLMMHFGRLAAPHFASAEIVERHHERKLDAPSGTSLRTAMMMNEARGAPWTSGDRSPAAAASRGAEVAGVRIHSLRLAGSVAHQEVILGSPGETLVIRHDSLDRSSFMPGVLLAVKRIGDLPGLTVGLERLLGL